MLLLSKASNLTISHGSINCSLPLVSEPIQHLYLQSEDDSQRSFEQKTLLQLKDIDPFTEKVILLFTHTKNLRLL